jgi:putative transposase
VPLHITQRGNHRERVFFTDGDRIAYLALLREYADKHLLSIVAYCLMPNHVHLVAFPRHSESLHRALKPLHSRYAQRINRSRDLKGHLWQGRFFSSILDESYFRAAIRYVELNPVRAGMVHRAEDFRWSSAAAHCGLHHETFVKLATTYASILPKAPEWSGWLAQGVDSESLERLRTFTGKNLPCGSPAFVKTLERKTGRHLQFRPRGGQPRERSDGIGVDREGKRPL